ncbi:peptidase M16 [Agaricicola taiwanensis]|uniref:Peptidase M16 n=1 Tax=Agaricicola taiwanensis TaxID=591372 RepID=A0A8J2VKK8_9RHOB|nr:pitrilysin family protein [Agaricicola taiwanensis]GGE34692.1 peptidase M16 [Agaricicola taiwanensis]
MSVEISRLSNGTAVVTERMPAIRTASLSVAFGAGVRSEQPREHGLAHFLEHMAFKGTSRRSAKDIAEEIEQVGGDLNAATGVEQTAYYARVLEGDVPLAMDILSDIVADPIFDPAEVRREKGVIVQEISAVDDTPDDLIFDLVQEAAFPDQALGRSILGTPGTVKALKRQDLISFREAHYCAPQAVVAAAGAVDHAHIVKLAEDHLALGQGKPAMKDPALFKGGERRIDRDLEQAHVALVFPGRALVDPATYAIQIYANILGGGMSSRLFQEVREKRGLAYSVYAFHWSYADTGMFGVYAGTGENSLAELMSVTLDEMAETAATLTEREVIRAKAQMRMGLTVSLEQPSSRIEQMTRHMFAFGQPLEAADILERLEATTVEDVRHAALAALQGPMALAAVGPIAGLASVDRLAQRVGAQAA